MLGRIYETGKKGVFINIEEAVRWYEDAAVRGDTASQARLAVLYGIEGKPYIDKQLGYAWAKIAYESGSNAQMKKPYDAFQYLLSPAEKSMGDSMCQTVKKLVTYNLKDLDLAP